MIDTSQIKEITSELRRAHFLSQCAHESMNFKVTEENLNYSSKALRSVFGKYFNCETIALKYHRKPEQIANRVYADRMGNGNEASGDGWKFRGRGFIQLSGYNNYFLFSEYIGEDCVANPDLVSTKYALESAAWYFTVNRLWKICDKGPSIAVIRELTKRINGGLNGINDRVKKFFIYFTPVKKKP